MLKQILAVLAIFGAAQLVAVNNTDDSKKAETVTTDADKVAAPVVAEEAAPVVTAEAKTEEKK